MQQFVISPSMDCMRRLREISEMIRGAKDVTITVEPGVYHWNDEQAQADFDALMQSRLDYDTHWGRAGIPYNKGVVFENVENLVLDGQGSTWMMHGLLSPVSIWNCKHVRLKNFSIDWERPLFSVGTVLSHEGDEVVVRIDDDFPVKGGEPIWALMDYDRIARRFGLIWKYRNMSALELIAPQTVRFRAQLRETLKAGSALTLRHVGNYRPCIHLWESEDVSFDSVRLYANPGMGVTAHYSRDIRFRRFEVRPRDDRLMSTNTDATHFITCSGAVDFEDCYFEGMGDDAVNVHGFYNRITELVDSHTVMATIDNENGTQDLRYDAPRPGDTAEFYDSDTLLPVWSAVVRETQIDEKRWCVRLTLEQELPSSIRKNMVFTKSNDAASLRIVNCRVNCVKSRGFLTQTKRVLIEGCRIERCTGTGIHVNTALGWCESIACEDVAIRHNQILDCGYGDGTYANACGITIHTKCRKKAVGVHKNVVIENNEICGCGLNGIVLSSLEHAKVCGNRIVNCNAAVVVESCDDIELWRNDCGEGRIVYAHESSPLADYNEDDDYTLPEF